MQTNRSFTLTLILAIHLGSLGCQSAGKKDATTTQAELPAAGDNFSSAKDVMELYDSSFEALFSSHLNKSGEEFRQLALLYNFYKKYSIWANVKTDGTMVAISKGRSNLILCVYEPGHPYLREPGPSLVTHKGENVEIHIRPNKVSKDFAGILLIHELSHVLDLINGTGVDSAEANETKAYFHEKKAANIAYGGALDRGLDKILVKIKPKDVTDLIRFRDTPDGRLLMQKLLIGIEEDMKIEQPASEAEAEMRLGFYSVALELRRQENENTGKTSYSISAEKVGRLLKAGSKY